MTTAPQPARPAQRMSSGRDVLSRMLQMEKQSKQQRSSSANSTILPLPKRTSFLGPLDQASLSPKSTPKSPLATPQPSQRPSPMPRSQTLPSLSTDARPSGKPMPSLTPLKINTSTEQKDPSPAEICLSPSWSDHGEKKRRREKKRMEKEQREAEKRLKQDQERQRAADVKAGKRLSKKPPPVAMETQKMSETLRRNSWASIVSSRTSSGENTRRSSREEKRLSGNSVGSVGSKTHSRSTPATSTEEAPDPAHNAGQWHSIVSPAAPKIPNFGWSSRRTSSGTNKSVSWGSEDAYTREVISFAYRLEGSPTTPEHDKSNEAKSRQGPITPTFSRSITESNLASVIQQSVPRSPQRPSVNRKDSSEARPKHEQKDPLSEHRNSVHSPEASPSFQMDVAGEMEAIMTSHHHRRSHNPSSPRSPQTRSSHDGSSYVHKQRMYQQQRSIAGFEDEQAVKDANEMAAKFEPLGEDGQQVGLGLKAPDTYQQNSNTVFVTSEIAGDRVPVSHMTGDSVMQPDVQLSPNKQQADVASSRSLKPNHKEATGKGQEGPKSRASQQSVRDSVSLNKTQTDQGFKTDRILSFRRRSKLAPSKISVPDIIQRNTVALQSVPTAVTVNEEPAEKRSKVESMIRETNPTQVHASGRKRSGSSTGSQPRESLPEPKPIQSHARNRTSSSTVLSDTLPSPMSPKSTTEPVLLSSSAAIKQTGDIDSREQHREVKPESPHSKPLDSVTTKEVPPDKPSAPKDAPAPVATTSKAMPIIKPIPEIVVESTTEEGVVRKTSIKRPRSNPQLQTQTTVTNSLPSLDFLPQLKHQPFVKRQPQFALIPKGPPPPLPKDRPLSVSNDRPLPVPKDYATIKSLATKPAVSSYAPDLKVTPHPPLRTPSQFPVPGRTFNRSATDIGTVSFGKGALIEGMEAKPIAKLFVVCCKCKFWHDLPSKFYEAMALPKELHQDETGTGGKGKGKVTGARLETAVKCPWCEHAMTTWCCQGWTTVVYLHERHH